MEDEEKEIMDALKELMELYNIPLEKLEPQEEEEEHENYSEMISKTQAKLDELNEKAEEIYEKTGMSREELEVYASNPDNFTREQWQILQKVKEACDSFKQKSTRIVDENKVLSKVVKEKKKESHRFAKKKHWIPL